MKVTFRCGTCLSPCLAAVLFACGGDDPTPVWAVSATLSAYSSETNVQQVDLLLDGHVKATQNNPPGGIAYLTLGSEPVDAGGHALTVRITTQATSPHIYNINGGVVVGSVGNPQDAHAIACGLPVDLSMATGAGWTCSFSLP